MLSFILAFFVTFDYIGELADDLNAKCSINPTVGNGLGRGLGHGFIRNTNQ